MRAAWASVETLTYRFQKEERLKDGEMIVEAVDVKLRKSGEFYIAAVLPQRGQEVIYSKRRDPTRLIAHPGTFPDVTVTLRIDHSLATKRQHHLVTHSGFEHLLGIVFASVDRGLKEPRGEKLRLLPPGELGGRRVESLVFEGGTLTAKRVRAQEDERLLDFAARVGCDPYIIAYYNDGLDSLSDELDAVDYVVPSYYGSKTEILVDAEYALPARVTVWDFEGRMYERLTFSNLVVNPPLTDLDFDPGNPAYNF
jgi:hypothetical protein